MYRRIHADYKEGELPRRKSATALGYDAQQDEAPKVIATGQGLIAEQILALAKEHGIPVESDPLLAAALQTLDLDEVIPPELYAIVAEIFVYIYRVRERYLLPSRTGNE